MLGTVKQSLLQMSGKWRSKWQLRQVPRLDFQTENLRTTTESELASIFASAETERAWQAAKDRLEKVCRIQDLITDGVNVGDRQAIWYLVHTLRPKSILEFGTHVGASTIHLASAMKAVHDATQEAWKITTLDIHDVNDSPDSYWKKYGLAASPDMTAQELQDLADTWTASLPEAHSSFFLNLALSFTCGDYFFAHAGVKPGISLKNQVERDLIWIRDEFLQSEKWFGKMVVHGHTPTPEPDFRPNRINIDTGAYATARLTCLVLEGADKTIL